MLRKLFYDVILGYIKLAILIVLFYITTMIELICDTAKNVKRKVRTK